MRAFGKILFENSSVQPGLFLLYIENHAVDAWFKRAYGDEADKKTPFALEIRVRSANCTKKQKEDFQNEPE